MPCADRPARLLQIIFLSTNHATPLLVAILAPESRYAIKYCQKSLSDE